VTRRRWCILLAGGLVLLAAGAIGLVVVRSVGGGPVTLANAASILPGMTESEVEAILGPPSEVETRGGRDIFPVLEAEIAAVEARWPFPVWTDKRWHGPDLTVKVFFRGSRVTDVEADRRYHPTLLQRVRALLP
jgi:hypothetical protein